MTIHHDKLAYGRLASMKEDSSEDKLKAMALRLSETKEDEEETAITEESAEQADTKNKNSR